MLIIEMAVEELFVTKFLLLNSKIVDSAHNADFICATE